MQVQLRVLEHIKQRQAGQSLSVQYEQKKKEKNNQCHLP